MLEGAAIALSSMFVKMDGLSGRKIEKTQAHLKSFSVGSTKDIQPQYPVEVSASAHVSYNVQEQNSEISWTRCLNSSTGQTLFGDAKEITSIGMDYQKRIRSGDIELCLPIIAYYGTGRLWDYHREKQSNVFETTNRLCAYCMCSIPRNDVSAGVTPIRIEHYVPRNTKDRRDVGQGLDYNNLLAVCNGNVDSSTLNREPIDFTCDVHKGNKELLKVNPCIPETLTSIFYYVDGKIDATDSDVRSDLIDTLNLNCSKSPIVSEREAALSELMMNMAEVQESELIDYCKSRLKTFQDEQDNKTTSVPHFPNTLTKM